MAWPSFGPTAWQHVQKTLVSAKCACHVRNLRTACQFIGLKMISRRRARPCAITKRITYIFIYICVCVCVCVFMRSMDRMCELRVCLHGCVCMYMLMQVHVQPDTKKNPHLHPPNISGMKKTLHLQHSTYIQISSEIPADIHENTKKIYKSIYKIHSGGAKRPTPPKAGLWILLFFC